VEQFLTDVYWGDLDFLLVDLPPGTGDVAISLGQLLPTGEHLVVTTPQLAAAQVAERSAAVGLQTGQSLLGVIENMAWLPQPDGGRFELFGAGGGELVAQALGKLSGKNVSLLGQIPLEVDLRAGADSGEPIVAGKPQSPAAQEISKIAAKLIEAGPKLVGKKLKLGTN
jgi:ATP-binding protein involved in chromosome partitioning